ncbi:MAG: aldo/keto reductase [Gemmatimonadota bacterium]|jgi:aryl-alcohol dehydrogenase-like predicted oxidoreductase
MAKDKGISRREFIHYSAAGLAAASAASAAGVIPGPVSTGTQPAMPTRTLGATGLEVSLLSFGGGSQFLANGEGEWEAMMARALEAGVNYFDTSSSYQYDSPVTSEERFGEVLSPIRDQVIIATKFDSRDPAEAMREVERSLQRMKTDYLDVLLIHALAPSDDVSALEKGVYTELRRLKEEGTVRFIGFSSMDSAERSREAIEKLEFDVALLAMNPTGYGGFVTEALPVARAKNMGVLAMKVMRDIVGTAATPEELLRWALSQEGVATALIGHHGMATLEENLRIVQAVGAEARPEMDHGDRTALEGRLAHLSGPHALCWARPGYADGMAC